MNERKSNIVSRLMCRRHRPGGVEVTTCDSLEEGDWIAQHRDGLQFSEFSPVTTSRTWVKVEEVTRHVNGDLVIDFVIPSRHILGRPEMSSVVVYPETLVKRRMETPR